MSRKTVWTNGQDTQIRQLRTEGATWDVVAQTLGLARCTVIERARALGVEHLPAHTAVVPHDIERAPLAPGHMESWGAINNGTLLQEVPFKSPDLIR